MKDFYLYKRTYPNKNTWTWMEARKKVQLIKTIIWIPNSLPIHKIHNLIVSRLLPQKHQWFLINIFKVRITIHIRFNNRHSYPLRCACKPLIMTSNRTRRAEVQRSASFLSNISLLFKYRNQTKDNQKPLRVFNSFKKMILSGLHKIICS